MITLKKKLIYENYFSRKSMDSCPFNLVMEEGIVTKILVRPEGKFSKLYFSKAYSSPSFINFPPLRHLLRNDVASSPRWWITIYVGSRKGVKKNPQISIFKKKGKSVSFLKYIYIYIQIISIYLSMKNLFETIRVKRDEREIKIRAEMVEKFSRNYQLLKILETDGQVFLSNPPGLSAGTGKNNCPARDTFHLE